MINLVQEYLTNSVLRFPDKTAAIFQDKNITFAELEEESNRLARVLEKRGVKRGDRVCFCLPKSIDSLKSILAILKSDAIYVPLDSRAPVKRLEDVIADSSPSLVICNDTTKALINGVEIVLNLDAEKDSIQAQSAAPLSYENKSEDVAYILYTSGSTGRPKGVMIRHSNIINATEWAVEELGISAEDRMSQHPPLHFDLSTFDLYCALKSGAALYLVPEDISLFPAQLVKFIEEKELTIWNSVPSVMVYMSLSGLIKSERLKTLKKIFFNGEGFPTKFLVEWMTTFPDKVFVNMYGPTETTVQCTYYVVREIPTDLTQLVPIGKACRNVEVFAVREDGKPAGIFEEGELYVGGLGVGAGYWNNAEKTSASFVIHPLDSNKGLVYKTGDLVRFRSDGNYEFLGRKDNQIKYMGYRIELGEIESSLLSLSYVKEVGVIAIDTEMGGKEIVAFVSVLESKSETDIKEDFSPLLPSYMIPKKIKFKDSLPRTSTLKIDRVKLKDEILNNG